MKIKKLLVVIITVIFLALFTTFPLLAKYIKNEDINAGIVTPDFYFESDLLEVPQNNGVYPKYTLSTGVTKISFKLKNYLDSFRFASEKIEYTVTLSGNVNKTKTGSINEGSCNEVDVLFTDLTSGTYTVVVTTTSPFVKTIKADFVVTEDDPSFTYIVNDAVSSPIIQVIITTNAYSGKLKLSWPDKVSPDNSIPILSGAISGNTYEIDVVEYAEYTLIFFKEDVTKVYTKTDISVSK